MKLYGNAQSVVQQIIRQFEAGTLPKALAPVFLRRNENVPCQKWSWNNRILTALAGYDDARGMHQWNAVGRYVRRGERAFHILAPVVVTSKTEVDENGKAKTAIVGFRATPVFGYEQTTGAPLPDRQHAEQFIESLPLREVAEAWGVRLSTYDASRRNAAGWYAPNDHAIGLGVENLATWAHELIHCADDQLGALKERGQNWQSETVAELGGATLLYALGYTTDADLGGAWNYIRHYAEQANISPVSACMSVLSRVCDAVDLVLSTAEQLNQQQTAQAA